jgi:hypothetical protein
MILRTVEVRDGVYVIYVYVIINSTAVSWSC